jgi:biotin carboxyl carrier protein
VQYEVDVNGRVRQVQVHRHGGGFSIAVEGREWIVDASRVDGHLMSLLLQPGGAPRSSGVLETAAASQEVTVTLDRSTGQFTVVMRGVPVTAALNARWRWGRSSDAGAPSGGPQRLTAPMPGKVVKVLVASGQAVRARQGLVVVEAMKMENELRAAADGIVAEVLVREGQSVEAGSPLLVVRPA